MRFSKFKQDKGVAGLTILLSLITMLFVIGLLVMIFSLMGGGLRDATYTSTSATATNQSVNVNSGTGATLSTLTNVACGTITAVYNATNHVLISSGNYTQVGCNLKNTTSDATLSYTGWKVSYPYTYDADNTATNVMNDTTSGISSVTGWYPIFIVIGAMVVLILLTVIIISAIRSSGLMVSGSTQSGTEGLA